MPNKIITTLLLTLALSSSVTAGQSCFDLVYDFINSQSDVFHRLRPDDWVKIEFKNGQIFNGKFKYIRENSVVFLGDDYRMHEYKTDHVLEADIELVYRETTNY